MDTRLGIRAMPERTDGDEVWCAWANTYPSVVAADITCAEVTSATATFVMEAASFPANPNGAVNGGAVSLAADQVMGVLAVRSAPAGCIPVTVVLNTQFHLPAMAPLIFHGVAIPGGRSVQTIEVVVTSADGRRCATATGTMAMGAPSRRAVVEE